MNHRPGNESFIRLGRGRPLSGEALATLWQAVISRSPTTDWAKGRVVTMGLTMVVLVWSLVAILDLVVPGLGEGSGRGGQVAAGAEGASGDNPEIATRIHTNERLPNDLFKVPQPKRNNTRKEPKTNPVELLQLIELQGVLGGSRPRAMVLYKRTSETVTVSVGDDLGEFEVMKIQERSVILKWREELFELSL